MAQDKLFTQGVEGNDAASLELEAFLNTLPAYYRAEMLDWRCGQFSRRHPRDR